MFTTTNQKQKNSQSKWVVKIESAPKKAKTILSAGKVMATVFWDAHGIIFTDYLEHGYHVIPHLQRKKVIFLKPMHLSQLLHCNAQNQRITIRIASPSTAFSRLSSVQLFHLFPKLKIWLRGKKINATTLK